MDDMNLKIKSSFMTGIINKIISKAIKKQLGYDIIFQVKEIHITNDENVIRFHADIDGHISNEEFMKLLKEVV